MDQLQVIAEPRRREILGLVWDREMAAGEIAGRFDVSFGAVSQHLGILREAGLVQMRREGNRRYYRADMDRLGPFREILERMWEESLDQLVETIEHDEEGGGE